MNKFKLCSVVFLGIIWIAYLSIMVYAIKDRFDDFNSICLYSDNKCLPKNDIGD